MVRNLAAQVEELHSRGFTIVVWASLPCTPWTTWAHVNQWLSPATAHAISAAQDASKRMIALLLSFLRRTRVGMVYEWPRHAIGWSCKEVQQLRCLLKFWFVFDGCSYGICNRDGVLIKKPWATATNLAPFSAIRAMCTKDHLHAQCRGQTAKDSGLYSASFARKVAQILCARCVPIQRVNMIEPVNDEGELPDFSFERQTAEDFVLALPDDTTSRPPVST